MAADPLDDYIDAVANALALPVMDAWKPAVRANLEASLKLAQFDNEAYQKLFKTGAVSDRQARQAAATAEQDAALQAIEASLETPQ